MVDNLIDYLKKIQAELEYYERLERAADDLFNEVQLMEVDPVKNKALNLARLKYQNLKVEHYS